MYPGSAAERRGLRAGDRIERVGRNPGGPTEQRILRGIAEGQAVTVERKVGNDRQMVTLDGEPAAPAPAMPVED